jgi:hypothetical protein
LAQAFQAREALQPEHRLSELAQPQLLAFKETCDLVDQLRMQENETINNVFADIEVSADATRSAIQGSKTLKKDAQAWYAKFCGSTANTSGAHPPPAADEQGAAPVSGTERHLQELETTFDVLIERFGESQRAFEERCVGCCRRSFV